MPENAYLAEELWIALGMDVNLFDDYYDRNGFGTTWSALLNEVREDHIEKCNYVTEEGRCILFKHGSAFPHYTLEDFGRDEPLPTTSRADGNLVTHAQRELELIGEEPETIRGYIKVIRAFAQMGHSGESAFVAIPTINQLLQFKNLKPLTNNPEEWFFHGPEMWDGKNGVWQNIRNGEAFSNDGGKTYYLISEEPDPEGHRAIYQSKAS